MNDHFPTRRAFLAGAAGGLVATSAMGAPAAAAAPARRPNFVIVLADDLGWGELGCYGQKMIETPNLDRLAAEGVRFTSAYSGAPLCAPSRASLLTGLHTGHSTVRENPEGGQQLSMTSADLTFGGLLKLTGYRTACIGKWGFGPEQSHQPSHPNARGFGEFFGFIGHRHAHQYWPHYLWHNRDTVDLGGNAYAPDLFLDRAKRFIKDAADSDDPFLLYLPTTLPHAPSEVPGTAGRYENKPWTRANRRHAAQVTRLDAHVGEVIRTLRECGVADSTIVLFSGDNGPHREKGVTPWLFDANGPFRADKRDLYEGGIRVPMIAWSPSLLRGGAVESEPVAFWDVLPTLADFAGVPVPDHLDGLSMRGLLTGAGGFAGHPHLFWNRPRKVQAVRRGHWKAVRFAPRIAGAGPGGRLELYDLKTDRGEKHDLAGERPELAAELDALMDASVAPDPRLPYGMRLGGQVAARGGRTHELVVTLHNGSKVSWDDLRIDLSVPKGWRVSRSTARRALEPGASAKVVFRVTPPSQTAPPRRFTSTARFSAGGRPVRFLAHRKIAVVAADADR
ncbi:Tat pathway signal sequence domain protein [Spongiactinospora gelatinilytica]|uniref:Tat pathway signal sequence domain protein n=1 Tax=Spongiactinospora gelatinilytica TaxID=2666298 RepID=A0A2W2H7V0_9ACTN|nr:sulfatase-like hydrolase/transferase [Spongiactinospora gelatinilytica]PZG45518.1 Tat pathway signal sequence domain protein [Spongiactinospora gelatinilytica]